MKNPKETAILMNKLIWLVAVTFAIIVTCFVVGGIWSESRSGVRTLTLDPNLSAPEFILSLDRAIQAGHPESAHEHISRFADQWPECKGDTNNTYDLFNNLVWSLAGETVEAGKTNRQQRTEPY